MTGDDAFLQSICENPDDDAHRLIYADWLEDRGDSDSLARAEFIRLQLEIERLSSSDPQHGQRLARGQLLLAMHEQSWVASELRGLAQRGVFRRGFVEKVSLPAEIFLQRADELLALAPVREVHLLGALDHCRNLALMPQLRRLRGLDLHANHLNEHAIDLLFRSPYLDQLTHVDLSNNEISFRTGWKPFAMAPLPCLNHLNLGLNHLGVQSMETLGASPILTQLTSLDLHGNRILSPGLVHLLHGPPSLQLTSLTLAWSGITAQGVFELANSIRMRSLTKLDLEWNTLGDDAIRALAGSPHLANLIELNLRTTGSGDGGAQALLQSRHLHSLQRLDLGHNRLTPATVAALRKRFEVVILD
jgi:uncharacterized protein (TIGR02996 family)